MGPDAAFGVCRFVHDTSAMLAWGAAGYVAALAPPDLADALGRRLRAYLTVVGLGGVLSILAALPLQAAVIGDGWADAVDPATIRAVLFETTVGLGWRIQAGCAALLLLALAIRRRMRMAAVAAASGLLLASLASTGHAVMQDGWRGAVHVGNDAVHVLAAGAWLGALVPLALLLPALGEPGRRASAMLALGRFSTAGYLAVGLVVLTGVGNTVLVLGHPPFDWSSRYQELLSVKLALVAAMVGLALVNRYGLVPLLPRHGATVVRLFRLAILGELALGFAVIALVAGFGMMEPT